MPKSSNRYDRLVDLMAERVRTQSDHMATELRGGNTPPGKVALKPNESLAEYLLLARPVEMLTPDEAAQADAIWQKRFAGRSRADIVEYCGQMEKLRMRQAPPVGGGDVADSSPVDVAPGGNGIGPGPAGDMVADALRPPL